MVVGGRGGGRMLLLSTVSDTSSSLGAALRRCAVAKICYFLTFFTPSLTCPALLSLLAVLCCVPDRRQSLEQTRPGPNHPSLV